MCYTLNNGWCLRSGQAVASQTPAREGGSTAGFISAVQAEKNRGGGRPLREMVLKHTETKQVKDIFMLSVAWVPPLKARALIPP